MSGLNGRIEAKSDFSKKKGKWYAFQLKKDGSIWVKPYENQSALHISMLYASPTAMDVIEDIEADTYEEAMKIAKKEIENV